MLIFAQAYVMCIVERNAHNSYVVVIRSERVTSMERKNFDVVRWLFLMAKFLLLLKNMISSANSSPPVSSFFASFRSKKQAYSGTKSCFFLSSIALILFRVKRTNLGKEWYELGLTRGIAPISWRRRNILYRKITMINKIFSIENLSS